MGKASNRKRQSQRDLAGDIHAQIQAEAHAARSAAQTSFRDAAQTPALAELLEGAREAIERTMPKSFEHEGRTYWLRCSLGLAKVSIYDTPATARPMVTAVCGSAAGHGHTPAH